MKGPLQRVFCNTIPSTEALAAISDLCGTSPAIRLAAAAVTDTPSEEHTTTVEYWNQVLFGSLAACADISKVPMLHLGSEGKSNTQTVVAAVHKALAESGGGNIVVLADNLQQSDRTLDVLDAVMEVEGLQVCS